MLSILIPVYNCKVTKLVKELYAQCSKLDIAFEILVFDDKSRNSIKKTNEHLSHMVNINYVELSENIGRSRIRNWLGTSARHDYLLFLDCDSRIKSNLFIKKYVNALKEYDVVYGGTIYNPKPKNIKKVLHWTFGDKRETKAAKLRNESSYLSFTSNNFAIKSKVFEELLFDKEIEGYGYEDLVFSASLKNKKISIFHIDNPVIHTGLETTDIYLKKIDKSIENLVVLHRSGKIMTTRLLQFYEKLKMYKMLNLILKFYQINEIRIMKNLYSEKPKLYYLDLYKLVKYHNVSSEYTKK